MTAPQTDRTIGQLVTDALDDVRSIVQHEKALLKAEVSSAAKAGGVGVGLLVAAVVTLSLALVFLLITAAEALVAAGLLRWAGYLVVGGALLLLAILLGLVGVASLKKVKAPQKAVEQGKGTVEDVKNAFGSDEETVAAGATRVGSSGATAAPSAGSHAAGRTG
ncbi:phage holin family protein [Aquipuribacter sp. MA13-6]|uniref:phage holin family protein n=1 Tax=unclassified Aquipuribacter TaxID=2635084 RepID=UPI003EE93C64